MTTTDRAGRDGEYVKAKVVVRSHLGDASLEHRKLYSASVADDLGRIMLPLLSGPGLVKTWLAVSPLKDLVPVVVGFLLTTVIGGFLGFLLQQRSWAHQHEVQLAEQERERAVKVFEEISRVMDKRLYRLRQVYWNLHDDGDTSTRCPAAEAPMDDYRAVLYEWNDSINRNLALVQQYFGYKMRNRLDYEVGSSFIELGRKVTALWKSDRVSGLQRADHDVDRRLDELGDLVYEFNLDMIRAIQSGAVGWLVPENRQKPT